MTPLVADKAERRRLINEARKTRNMGSTLAVEDCTNPVCEYRCIRLSCFESVFQRRYASSGAWLYHCQQPMVFLGPVTE